MCVNMTTRVYYIYINVATMVASRSHYAVGAVDGRDPISSVKNPAGSSITFKSPEKKIFKILISYHVTASNRVKSLLPATSQNSVKSAQGKYCSVNVSKILSVAFSIASSFRRI